jgi:hypothetical protein
VTETKSRPSPSGGVSDLLGEAEAALAISSKLHSAAGYGAGALRRYEETGSPLYLAVAELEFASAARRAEALVEALHKINRRPR